MTIPRVAVRTDSARLSPIEDESATVLEDPGYGEARRRFGGVDGPATLAGALTALGTAVLVAGVLSGLGTIGYQLGIGRDAERTAAALVGGAVTLVFAFLAGGWVAGRVARYDGGRNGALTALWFAALAAASAFLGALAGREFDVFANVDLPRWFSSEARSVTALLSALAAIVLCAVCGWIGGQAGERWHRRADALIVHTRSGAMTRLEAPLR